MPPGIFFFFSSWTFGWWKLGWLKVVAMVLEFLQNTIIMTVAIVQDFRSLSVIKFYVGVFGMRIVHFTINHKN